MGADSGISEELEEDSRSSSIDKADSESGDSSANVNQDTDGKREREKGKERGNGDAMLVPESALQSI